MANLSVLWIIDENNEVLLAQRSQRQAQDPMRFGPAVVTELQQGESYDQALWRAANEQLELPNDQFQPRFLYEKQIVSPRGDPYTFHIYFAQVPHDKINDMRVSETIYAGILWVHYGDLVANLQTHPLDYVSWATAVWPETFGALESHNLLKAEDPTPEVPFPTDPAELKRLSDDGLAPIDDTQTPGAQGLPPSDTTFGALGTPVSANNGPGGTAFGIYNPPQEGEIRLGAGDAPQQGQGAGSAAPIQPDAAGQSGAAATSPQPSAQPGDERPQDPPGTMVIPH